MRYERSFYIVLEKKSPVRGGPQVVSFTKTRPPKLRSGQVAVKINLNIPEEVFPQPLTAELDLAIPLPLTAAVGGGVESVELPRPPAPMDTDPDPF